MLSIIAAAQLTVADLTDLRCVYVYQTASTAVTGDNRWAMTTAQTWFEGRLSARNPQLHVMNYVTKNFVFPKRAVGDADLRQCSQIFARWQEQELGGGSHATPQK